MSLYMSDTSASSQNSTDEVTSEVLGRTAMCRQAYFDAAHDYKEMITKRVIKNRKVIADIVRQITPCDSRQVHGFETPEHSPEKASVSIEDAADTSADEDVFLNKYIAIRPDTMKMPNKDSEAWEKLTTLDKMSQERPAEVWQPYVEQNYFVRAMFRPGMSHPCEGVAAKFKGQWFKTTFSKPGNPENQRFATSIAKCPTLGSGEDAAQISEMAWWNKSYLQEALETMGVNDDVFCICDTEKGNVREDLAAAEPRQTFYWMQTPQTLFDPASKIQWDTSLGAPRATGFFEKDSPVKYAWQTATRGIKQNMLYPAWPTDEAGRYKTQLERNAPGALEEQLCANVDSVMLNTLGKENNPFAPKQQKGVLQIKDANTGKYVYITSDLASRNFQTTSPSSSAVTSYVKQGMQFIADLAASIVGVGDKKPADVVAMYANPHLFMGKRFGDGAQAAICCQPSLAYSTPSDEAYEARPLPKTLTEERQVDWKKADGTPLMTNGNHMFVTLDRLAAATALLFYAPLVVYSGNTGLMLFVRKDVPNPAKRLESLMSRVSKPDGTTESNLNCLISLDSAKVTANMNKVISTDSGAIVSSIKQCMESISPLIPMMSADGKLIKVGSWTSAKGLKVVVGKGVQPAEAASESLRSYVAMYFGMTPFLVRAIELDKDREAIRTGGSEFITRVNLRGVDVGMALIQVAEGLSSVGISTSSAEGLDQVLTMISGAMPPLVMVDDSQFTISEDVMNALGKAMASMATVLIAKKAEIEASEEKNEEMLEAVGNLMKSLSNGMTQMEAIVKDLEGRSTSGAKSADALSADLSDEGFGITSYAARYATAPAEEKLQFLYKVIPRSCLSNVESFKPHAISQLRIGSRQRSFAVSQLEQQLKTSLGKSEDNLAITKLIAPAWDMLTSAWEPGLLESADIFRQTILTQMYNSYMAAGGDSMVNFTKELNAASIFMTALNTLGNVLSTLESSTAVPIPDELSGFAKAMVIALPNSVPAQQKLGAELIMKVDPDNETLKQYDDFYKSRTTVSAAGVMSGGGDSGYLKSLANTIKVSEQQSVPVALGLHIKANQNRLATLKSDPAAYAAQIIPQTAKNGIIGSHAFNTLASRLYTPMLLHLARYKQTDGDEADITLKMGQQEASYSAMVSSLSEYLLHNNTGTGMTWTQEFQKYKSEHGKAFIELAYQKDFKVPKGSYELVDGKHYRFKVALPSPVEASVAWEYVYRANDKAVVAIDPADQSLRTDLGVYAVVAPMPRSVLTMSGGKAAYSITFTMPSDALDMEGTSAEKPLKEAVERHLTGQFVDLITSYDSVMKAVKEGTVNESLKLSEDDTESDLIEKMEEDVIGRSTGRQQVFFNALQTEIDDGNSPDGACNSLLDPVALLVAYQDWYSERLATGPTDDSKIEGCEKALETMFKMDFPGLVEASFKREERRDSMSQSGGAPKRGREEEEDMYLPDRKMQREEVDDQAMQVDADNGIDEELRPAMEAIGPMAEFLFAFFSQLGDFRSGKYVHSGAKTQSTRQRVYLNLTYTLDQAVEGTKLDVPLPVLTFDLPFEKEPMQQQVSQWAEKEISNAGFPIQMRTGADQPAWDPMGLRRSTFSPLASTGMAGGRSRKSHRPAKRTQRKAVRGAGSRKKSRLVRKSRRR